MSDYTLSFVYPTLEGPEIVNNLTSPHSSSSSSSGANTDPPNLTPSTTSSSPNVSARDGVAGHLPHSSSTNSLFSLSQWKAGQVGLSRYSATTFRTVWYDSEGIKTVNPEPPRVQGHFTENPLVKEHIKLNKSTLSRVQAKCDEIARTHACVITVQEVKKVVNQSIPGDPVYLPSGSPEGGAGDTTWNFTLKGPERKVEAARLVILREFQVATGVIIKVPQRDILLPTIAIEPHAEPQLQNTVQSRLDQISQSTFAHISVERNLSGNLTTHTDIRRLFTGTLDGLGNTDTNVNVVAADDADICSLVITGPMDAVQDAKLQILIFLDELNGLDSLRMTIDWRLHSVLSGPKNAFIARIERDSNTNIYTGASPVQRDRAGSSPSLNSILTLQANLNSNPIPHSNQNQNSHQMTNNNLASTYHTPSNSSPGFNLSPPHNDAPGCSPLLTPPATYRGRAPSPQGGVGGGSGSSALSGGSGEYFGLHFSSANAFRNVLSQIVITGSQAGICQARDMMQHHLNVTTRKIANKELLIPCRKLDWLMTERGFDVKRFCTENGTFISVPETQDANSLSASAWITVGGESQAQIDRTVKQIVHLVPQHCSLSVWLIPISSSSPNPHQFSAFHAIVGNIASATGAQVIYHEDKCFEMYGSATQVRKAGTYVLEMLLSMPNIMLDMRLQVECPLEHRDFISGKKDGKIKKIMTATGTRVRYESISEFTFSIEIWGNDHSVLCAFDMIAAEMPAEGSFFLSENFHKRIIGAKGQTIQEIMRKYGVYIKFASMQECIMLGGFIAPEDNVLMRTPAKNFASLEKLRLEVMAMVEEKDREFIRARLHVPRRFHRALANERRHRIDFIERNSGLAIYFPGKIQAEDYIEISGLEGMIDRFVGDILYLVPAEKKVIIPCNSKIQRLLVSPDLANWVLQVRGDLRVDVVPCSRSITGRSDQAVFLFSCEKMYAENLSRAEVALRVFLGQHEVLTTKKMSPSSSGRVQGLPTELDFPPVYNPSQSSPPSPIRTHSDVSSMLMRRTYDLNLSPLTNTDGSSRIQTRTSSSSSHSLYHSASGAPPTSDANVFGPIGSDKPSRANSISSQPQSPLADNLESRSIRKGAHRTQSLDLRDVSLFSTALKSIIPVTPTVPLQPVRIIPGWQTVPRKDFGDMGERYPQLTDMSKLFIAPGSPLTYMMDDRYVGTCDSNGASGSGRADTGSSYGGLLNLRTTQAHQQTTAVRQQDPLGPDFNRESDGSGTQRNAGTIRRTPGPQNRGQAQAQAQISRMPR